MSLKLDKETVENVARLARLKLTQNEVESFSQQLSAVLDSFEQISSINTTGVQPLVTPTDMVLRMRADEVEPVAETDVLLSNAAEKSGRLFKVPPVV